MLKIATPNEIKQAARKKLIEDFTKLVCETVGSAEKRAQETGKYQLRMRLDWPHATVPQEAVAMIAESGWKVERCGSQLMLCPK